ncbi:agmatine deiminase family protein [Rufibacter sediminis]|uniref:Agmatine deiminase family protein n=1 Tax=Rufibacter sediminis TaxID=2762756 RepID=A0ABR6VMD6_9BACT|nr:MULTISPECIES: agmatine deiminase family protein [Rufibacter]MBC3538366.1 agmatine deiminase family protein [Rufibacter sediminis]
MVIDKETNKVFFSDQLFADSRYGDTFDRICSVLEKHQIEHGIINSTKDIWCRDYMPIQKAASKFIQFRYEPSYLAEDLDLQTDPKTTLELNQIQATFSSINVDGGNVLRWEDRVIITDRIFQENPAYTNKSKLVDELEKLFEAEVIVIPQIKSDMTGHADGLVRFYDRTTLIGNCLEEEYDYWKKGMKKVLSDYSLSYIDMPFLEYKVKGYPESAIGCYVNYLEVANLILAPIFEVEGNKDEEAVGILTEVFADRTVEPININDVAIHGGLLNCISWNVIKGEYAYHTLPKTLGYLNSADCL